MSMFMWSSDGIFGDKDNDDDQLKKNSNNNNSQGDGEDEDVVDEDDLVDEEDDDDDEEVPASDHPVFGKTWAYGPTKNTGASSKYSARKGDAFDPAGRDEDEKAVDEEREEVQKLMNSLFKMTKGPDDIDRIRAQTSEDASDAFRRIVLGIFGSVPGDAFEVLVNTDIDGVTRLMQSALSTGYALRNAEWRMTLSDNLNFGSNPYAPSPNSNTTPSGDNTSADNTNTTTSTAKSNNNINGNTKVTSTQNVGGNIEWWDSALDTKVSMSVQEYITKLEGENELLKERLRATKQHSVESNKILDYMRSVSPDRISVLQKDMSKDVLEMFRSVIRKILGEIPNDKVEISYSTTRDWISQLCYWCCLVGYHVRNLEKRLEMTRMLAVELEDTTTPTNDPDINIVQSSPSPAPKDELNET